MYTLSLLWKKQAQGGGWIYNVKVICHGLGQEGQESEIQVGPFNNDAQAWDEADVQGQFACAPR
jgi:hypothetical protein